ncbi:MAG: recombinase family protein [Gammaproteobacteria bacterium]|nr:recombinase family protein [Gammaproteobacteria bacterium]MYJ51684.1 recombinase family protein [Gammaproteobacteria bacterium]
MLIGYAWAFSPDQNPDSQKEALRDAGCKKIFVETAEGISPDRPQLMAALESSQPGDTLMVWKLSRLARSLRQLIKTVELVRSRRLQLKVLTQNIDTSTHDGELFFHVTATFNEFQRDLIVENTRTGLRAARKRGRGGGRPRALDETKLKNAEAMLRDTDAYPHVGDVIDQLEIGRTAFYRYFPPERIRQFRGDSR